MFSGGGNEVLLCEYEAIPLLDSREASLVRTPISARLHLPKGWARTGGRGKKEVKRNPVS